MGGIRLRRAGNMLFRAKKLLKSGIFEEPIWLQAMEKVPPTEILKGKTPPKITFPETELIKYYMKANPKVLTVPVRLDGPEPAIARRFALRQMEVMEQKGISKSEAAALVQQEMDAEAAKLPKEEELSIVQQVQADESRELHTAMKKMQPMSPIIPMET